MVYVTVLLLRCGENEVDAFGDFIPLVDNEDDVSHNSSTRENAAASIDLQHEHDVVLPVSDDEDDEEYNNKDNSKQHNNKDTFNTEERGQDIADQMQQPAQQQQLEEPTQPRRLRLSEYVDPYLTQKGYRTAQTVLTSLLAAISQSTPNERRMACFSAPTKACTGTAYMIGCSNLNQYNNLRWQLSTKTCLQAPCAIPIVVHNTLCAKETRIDRCGGHAPVMDAGLLHCSAAPWNDARQKCPFSRVVKQFKHNIQHWVREWKEHKIITKDKEEEEEEEEQMRRVLDIQFFRLEHPSNPWSLNPMVLKNNALIDLMDPFRYMTPPRKGNLAAKRAEAIERPGPAESVQQAVWWARQVGCDVVLLVVGEAVMQELARAGGLLGPEDQLEVPPCSLASLIADVPDALDLNKNSSSSSSDENDTDESDRNPGHAAAAAAAAADNNKDHDSIENENSDNHTHSNYDSNDEHQDNEENKDESKQDDNSNSDENEEKVADGYDYTNIQLGFHGFFTLEDLLNDPSQVIPAYTGPVDVLVPPPADNNPMEVPVNQWSVFPPPKPENLPPNYPDLPPFSQALQFPLPKRPEYTPPKPQYEKQISPRVAPPVMPPNPYMSPQRHGVPFTSPHSSPAPPPDGEATTTHLDQSPRDGRVPYGQGQAYPPPRPTQHHPNQPQQGQPYPSKQNESPDNTSKAAPSRKEATRAIVTPPDWDDA